MLVYLIGKFTKQYTSLQYIIKNKIFFFIDYDFFLVHYYINFQINNTLIHNHSNKTFLWRYNFGYECNHMLEEPTNERRQGSILKEAPWKTLALNERCGYAPRI